jgi:hypothetical protein
MIMMSLMARLLLNKNLLWLEQEEEKQYWKYLMLLMALLLPLPLEDNGHNQTSLAGGCCHKMML